MIIVLKIWAEPNVARFPEQVLWSLFHMEEVVQADSRWSTAEPPGTMRTLKSAGRDRLYCLNSRNSCSPYCLGSYNKYSIWIQIIDSALNNYSGD